MWLSCYAPFKLVKPGREVSCAWAGDSVSPKTQGAAKNRDGAIAPPREPEPGVSAEISADLASVAIALAQDEEDGFSEVPTVANRANPTVSPSQQSEIDKDGGQGLGGAGAYRMLHPATSDRIAVPSPTGADRPAANRVIIGVARKSSSG